MKNRKIRCRNCGNYFYPNNYNRHHQVYCSSDACQKASHRASSRKYRKKKSTNTAFRNKESARIKQWQSENPDYWKNRKKSSKNNYNKELLRDFAQAEKLQSDITLLRDFTNLQYSVIKGLIITLTGDVLRDNIDDFIRKMYDKSLEVSGRVPEKDLIMQLTEKRTNNDQQNVNRQSS